MVPTTGICSRCRLPPARFCRAHLAGCYRELSYCSSPEASPITELTDYELFCGHGSGGSGASSRSESITALRPAVWNLPAAALVEFCEIVLDHDLDHGRSIRSLDYQAHPTAQHVIEQCCAQFAASSGLRVIAAHRVGAFEIGDIALYSAVAASHRREAFDACEEMVEQIKLTIPIWKRQRFSDGTSEWVGL